MHSVVHMADCWFQLNDFWFKTGGYQIHCFGGIWRHSHCRIWVCELDFFKKSSKPRPSRIVLNVFVVNSAWFWPAFIGNREDTSQNCKVRATVPSDKATDNGETPSTWGFNQSMYTAESTGQTDSFAEPDQFDGISLDPWILWWFMLKKFQEFIYIIIY